LGEGRLSAVEGEEGIGAKGEGDCNLEDVERTRAEGRGVIAGEPAGFIPRSQWQGNQLKNPAVDIRLEVVQGLTHIEPIRLATKYAKLESVSRLKNDDGAHEHRKS
jgi:hypothetical protein